MLEVYEITILNPWTHKIFTFEAFFEGGYWWSLDEGYGERKLIHVEPLATEFVRQMERPEETKDQARDARWQRIHRKTIEGYMPGLDDYKWAVALDLKPGESPTLQYFRCDICNSKFYPGGDAIHNPECTGPGDYSTCTWYIVPRKGNDG